MMVWTESAEHEFAQYRARMRRRFLREGEGADADEVVDDIRRHMHEELEGSGVEVVTRELVRNTLQRLGQPIDDAPEDAPPPLQPAKKEPRPYRQGYTSRTFVLLFGVLLPLTTLVIELTTRMCAAEFFDPLPTPWHVALSLTVPLANLVFLFCSTETMARHRRKLGTLNGIALGVAAYYSLLFLPLAPLAIMAVVIGLGFLPLSPHLSLLALLGNRYALRRSLAATGAPTQRAPGLVLGLLTAFVLFNVVQLPETLTNLAIRRAVKGEPAERAAAIELLREWGSEDVLLERCYGPRVSTLDVVSLWSRLADPIRPAAVRPLYYRVTGQPFNAVEPPADLRRSSFFGGDWGATMDPDVGGTAVAGRVEGLSLVSSLVDGVVEPDAAQAYVEWTMVFDNRSHFQQEARTLVQLPPDAVVSRVTLWVDGEEREAAFAGRSEAREAYQAVVVRKRDPLLVTTDGPDRVLVQCFPILPDGGQMKIRIGYTAPLLLDPVTQARLPMATMLERNFAIGDDLQHSLWFESPRPLQARGLTSDQPEDELFVARGKLSDADLHRAGFVVEAERVAVDAVAVAIPDSKDVVRARFEPTQLPGARRIVFVVDTSFTMEDTLPAIADALEKMPIEVEFALILAADDVTSAVPLQVVTDRTYFDAATLLREVVPVGGRDAVPALERALEIVSTRDDEVVVWLHGPQPVVLRAVEPLLQRFRRSGGARPILDLQVSSGPNHVSRELARAGAVERIARTGALADDLERLVRRLAGYAEELRTVRERVARADLASDTDTTGASMHLHRLWAHDEVRRLVRRSGDANIERARALAIRSQLVTSVSGAVVLENAAQYRAAGLSPVDSTSVPTVPEPEMIVLIAILVLMLVFAWRRARRRAVTA